MNKYRRNLYVIFTDEDRKEQLYHPKSGSFYELNEVGSLIWDELIEWVTVEEIVTKLLKKFEDAPRTLVENDVRSFVNSLNERELIEIIVFE